jgi:gliding motility-associated lipoprotein GldH
MTHNKANLRRIKSSLRFPGFVAVLLMVLTACTGDVVYREYKTFNDNAWRANEPATFEVTIHDTLSLCDISLMVRHADSYPYNNVFLFVTSSYPDGRVLRDTMEVVLANSKGEWLGSGMGDLFDFKVPVKRNVRFPRSGKYTFAFVQARRVDPLPLILDFGFEIRKVKRSD